MDRQSLKFDAPAGYRFLAQCLGMSADESLAWVRNTFSAAKSGQVVFRKGVYRMDDACRHNGRLPVKWHFERDGGFVAYVKIGV